MGYTKTDWENLPSTNTPVSQSNLNKMEQGIYDATYENGLNISTSVDEDYRVNLLKIGKNMFNNAITNNTWINQSGEVISYPLCSIFRYDCSEGDTFTLSAHWSVSDGANNGGIIAFYNSNGVLLSRNPSAVSNDLVLTKTAPANTAYMYAGHFSAVPQTIQLEKGSRATTYEPFVENKIVVDNEKYTDTLNVGQFDSRSRVNVLYSKNLFDYNNYTINNTSNGTFTITNDTLNFNNNTGNAYVISFKKIKVKPNTTYTLNGIPNDPNNNNLIYIKFEYDSSGTQVKQNYPQALNTNTFTTTSATQYIELRLTTQNLNTQGNYSFKAMLNEGDTALDYEPYITPSIYVDNEEIYSKDNLEQYSTGEIRIGTWIDGKPLYRKVIDFGALPNNSNKAVNSNISNLDKIIKVYASARRSDKTAVLIPYTLGNESIGIYYGNDNAIHIITSTDRSAFTCQAIVEYTKTTD